jgi:ArsR family transcriptional regulator, nickel/cobalt-responsive transcriptional repressor
VPHSSVHSEHRSALVDPEEAGAIARRMQALATPSRVLLLFALGGGERSVGELSRDTGLHPSAASQQLRILRHLDLVATRRDGRSILYRLHDDHVASLLDEIRGHLEHTRLGLADAPSGRVIAPGTRS